jgi:hypothetical protein
MMPAVVDWAVVVAGEDVWFLAEKVVFDLKPAKLSGETALHQAAGMPGVGAGG